VKYYLVFSLVFALLVCGSAVALAQDDTVATDDDSMPADDTVPADDTAADDDFTATVEFSAPTALEADTEYDFTFTVSNTTSPTTLIRWIYDVEMFLPSSGYTLNEDLPEHVSPRPDSGTWTAEPMDDDGTAGIKWQFTGIVTSEAYGDIRDGEAQDFSFKATTDGTATDGFDWRLIALDDATPPNEYELFGKAYIGEEPDDDTVTDDTTVDDDLSAGDDDSGGGGCGC
jgi:hypothetical protein